MTKKIIAAVIVAAFSLTARAAELKRHTNVYDKIPAAGYVGFAGIEVSAPSAFNGGGADYGITTSHGWMLRPTFFLGAGAGYIRNFHYGEGVIPIFAEAKLYFASQYMRRIYPHIGLRVGGQIATEGGSGVYSQLACGFRVPVSEKLAINVEIGPQYSGRYSRQKRSDEINIGGPFKAKGTKFGFFGRVALEF